MVPVNPDTEPINVQNNYIWLADDRFAELVDALGVAAQARNPVTGDLLPDAFVIALGEAGIMRLGIAADVIRDEARDREQELTRAASDVWGG